jgi:glycerol uptake facilitator-like aquaporin
MIKKYLAEFFGTGLLVFLGTVAIIFSEEYKDSFNVFTIALVFGITVSSLIYYFGQFSDCIINPAVTITFVLNKELPFQTGVGYITMQSLGAILASFCWYVIFPSNLNLGNTIPSVPIVFAFALEFAMSGLLLFGILYARVKVPNYISLVVGTIVFIEAWLGGPFTGASMNPARTLGPSILSGNYLYLWVYIIAPISGMLIFYKLYHTAIQQKKQIN